MSNQFLTQIHDHITRQIEATLGEKAQAQAKGDRERETFLKGKADEMLSAQNFLSHHFDLTQARMERDATAGHRRDPACAWGSSLRDPAFRLCATGHGGLLASHGPIPGVCLSPAGISASSLGVQSVDHEYARLSVVIMYTANSS